MPLPDSIVAPVTGVVPSVYEVLAVEPDCGEQAVKERVVWPTVGQAGFDGEKLLQSLAPPPPPPVPLSGPSTLVSVTVVKRPVASVMTMVSRSTQPFVIAVKKPPETCTGEPRMITTLGTVKEMV